MVLRQPRSEPLLFNGSVVREAYKGILEQTQRARDAGNPNL